MSAEQQDPQKLAQAIDDLLASADGLDEAGQRLSGELVDAIEAFHRAGLVRLTQLLTRDNDTRSALREAASDPLVYTMLRRHGLIKPSMQEQALAALHAVRPQLQGHGGDVELIDIELPGTVIIRLLGACDGCGSSQVTLREGVERALREHCAWVTSVIAENEQQDSEIEEQVVKFVSPFAGSMSNDSVGASPAGGRS